MIADIINDIEQDDDIRNLINDEPDKDEGIGLNLEDEIVEPFDFETEVNQMNF